MTNPCKPTATKTGSSIHASIDHEVQLSLLDLYSRQHFAVRTFGLEYYYQMEIIRNKVDAVTKMAHQEVRLRFRAIDHIQ